MSAAPSNYKKRACSAVSPLGCCCCCLLSYTEGPHEAAAVSKARYGTQQQQQQHEKKTVATIGALPTEPLARALNRIRREMRVGREERRAVVTALKTLHSRLFRRTRKNRPPPPPSSATRGNQKQKQQRQRRFEPLDREYIHDTYIERVGAANAALTHCGNKCIYIPKFKNKSMSQSVDQLSVIFTLDPPLQ